MIERWRRPVKIEAIEPDPDNVMTIGDRQYRNYDVTLATHADFDRIRLGYVCVQCFEAHEHPFPVRCSVCGFEMARLQNGRVQQAYKGEKWLGPRESLLDELERMDEDDDRKKHRPGSRILLPRGVTLDD